MHLTHTGMLGVDVSFDIPVVSMAAEDQAQLERYLERGDSVRVHLDFQNRFTDGGVPSANVVGEIHGTADPEQIVVVGGHLDSWDLASRSTDNGWVATTLGAAVAIVRAGFEPRRTIRFVLFTGEEQGDDGSFNSVRFHKDEMANRLAVVILDDGQGAVIGLALGGRNDLITDVQRFAGSLKAFGALSVDDEPFSIPTQLPSFSRDCPALVSGRTRLYTSTDTILRWTLSTRFGPTFSSATPRSWR